MQNQHTTAELKSAMTLAAEALVFSMNNRSRQSACPFLRSHRDGICVKCTAMQAHDAGLVSQQLAA